MRLIVKKNFQALLLPISVMSTSLKGFGQTQTYVTTLYRGEREGEGGGGGANWIVSSSFAPDCGSKIN